MARFDESEHPRWPAGAPDDRGGEFRPKSPTRDLATLSRSTLLKYVRDRGPAMPRGASDDQLRQAIRSFDSGGGEDWAQRVSTAVARKRAPAKAKSPVDLVGETVSKLRAAQSETEAIEILAGDPRLRASVLRQIADEIGIAVPDNMRAKTALQLYIAGRAPRTREPRDMIDPETAQAMLDRTGARDDVKHRGGHFERAEYWVDADPVLEEIAYEQWGGAAATPVGAAELDRMRAERQVGIILYRGVEDGGGGVTAGQIHDQMHQPGKIRLGNGIFGNGWYMATTRRHAESYGVTARYGLRADARTTTWEDLLVEYAQWEREQQQRLGRPVEWDDRREVAYESRHGTIYPPGDPVIAAFGSDLGRFAAARGYDAYRVKKGTSPGIGAPAGGNQWVILNRGALVADTETRTGKAKS